MCVLSLWQDFSRGFPFTARPQPHLIITLPHIKGKACNSWPAMVFDEGQFDLSRGTYSLHTKIWNIWNALPKQTKKNMSNDKKSFFCFFLLFSWLLFVAWIKMFLMWDLMKVFNSLIKSRFGIFYLFFAVFFILSIITRTILLIKSLSELSLTPFLLSKVLPLSQDERHRGERTKNIWKKEWLVR